MSEQLSVILKRKLEDLASHSGIDAETRRNALKEELQYHVLNFIYHHRAYSDWIMYGGSALRMIHGLNRMSVDLDFEIPHAVTEKFLEELKKELEEYFLNTYGAGDDFFTVKIAGSRGLVLKFHVGEELSFGHESKQVHVKIDLNHFVAPRTVTERRPINRDQLSFVIVTYNMSALMASKLAAIFLRGTRGVGGDTYEEKGRDIYDLLWYMDKKVVPDFDYLIAKGIDVKDPHALFDKLTLKMNKVSNENLKQDLSPLFFNQTFIGDWLQNWRESYLRLLGDYKIRTVTILQKIILEEDQHSDNFSFVYCYGTVEGVIIRITYIVTFEWVVFEKVLGIPIDDTVLKLVTSKSHKELSDQLKQFVTLFSQKTEAYFTKTSRMILGDQITTKVIRTTADKLNQKEQIVQNRENLLSCDLDDLLK